jgi:hypothetical protein
MCAGKKRLLLEVPTNYCKGKKEDPIIATTTTAAHTNIETEDNPDDKYREILDENHESENRY